MNEAANAFDATELDFEERVVAASHAVPIVVDFWAPWCGPCTTLKPILERLASEYGGRFRLARVNSDEAPSLAARYQVRSIPSVKAFVSGRIVDEFVGVLPEAAIRQFLDRLQPTPAELMRNEARELAARESFAEAIALLQQALADDPRHEGTRLDLAELHVRQRDFAMAETVLDHVFVDEADRAQALRATLSLASASGDLASLRAAVARDETDAAARLALGRALAADGDYPGALEQLLASVRLDRALDDQLARRTVLQLFDLLASDPARDDLVREYRRALASALN
ncbi:MAG TPA: tetratricopeptide repeat protein [Rhodocyclaceae bacterium]